MAFNATRERNIELKFGEMGAEGRRRVLCGWGGLGGFSEAGGYIVYFIL